MLNYKKNRAEISSLHSKLRNKHGSATNCSNKKCEKRSAIYEWALKKGRKYSDKVSDYLWLCRSCHRRYDLTSQKRLKAIKNLCWYGTKKQLKKSDVEKIRKMVRMGVPKKQLAREYEVAPSAIRQIIQNKTWRI